MIGGAQRLRTAYLALDNDQRFAAAAALGLLVAMFLPWYEKSVVLQGSATFTQDTISAFGAVSFVEAAIFLVSLGVLVLVLARADKRPFHLPGGDGTVIFGAGMWAAALIFYRVFDRPDVSGDAGTVGIQWGFFVAFVAAGVLAFAGQRIRAAGRPEPARRPRPGADGSGDADFDEAFAPGPPGGDGATTVTAPTQRRPGAAGRTVTRADAEQLTFDDPAEEPPQLRKVPPAGDGEP